MNTEKNTYLYFHDCQDMAQNIYGRAFIKIHDPYGKPNDPNFFESFSKSLRSINDWSATTLETSFKQLAETSGIKAGELQLPLRIMLVGGKFGPPVFNIAEVLGKEETLNRIDNALIQFAALR